MAARIGSARSAAAAMASATSGAGEVHPQVLQDRQLSRHRMPPSVRVHGCAGCVVTTSRIQARWTASATSATAKIRERVALLTRPAVKRAPSQAPMTEAIEVTITVGQSKVAVGRWVAKAENDGSVTATEFVAAARRAL